jgi:DNA-binding NtrC family response regulator
VALSVDEIIRLDDVITPEMIGQESPAAGGTPRQLQDIVDDAERVYIEKTLREVDGNKEKAAEKLGLSSTTLWRKMKRLNVVWP